MSAPDKAGKRGRMHAAIDNALGDGRTNRGRPMPASSGALRLPLASSGQCPAFCFRVSKTQEKTRRPCKLTAPTPPSLNSKGPASFRAPEPSPTPFPLPLALCPMSPALTLFAKPAPRPSSGLTLNSPARRHCPLHPLFATLSTFIHTLYVPFKD